MPRQKDTRPWAIYARLSKFSGDLAKVPYQIEQCQEHADENDIPTDPELVFADNSLSAWKPNVRRPAWEEMMKRAEEGALGGILVWEISRFTRRVGEGVELLRVQDAHRMRIGGPDCDYDLSTPEGQHQFIGACNNAQLESARISKRAKNTLGRKMRNGKPMGSGRPFGFEVGGQAIRDDEAQIIREVARRMLSGETVTAIVADLNERGVQTTRGKAFNSQNLVRVMVRPRNGGHVELHGENVGTICAPDGSPLKPILDAETYDDLTSMVSARRRGRPNSGRYLLTGLARCAKCDRPMNGAQLRHKPGAEPVRVYHCAINLGGCSRSIRADATERIVGDYMAALLAKPDTMIGVAEKESKLSDARAKQLAAVDEIEEQLAELEVKRAEGIIRPRAYERAKAVYDRKLAQAEADLGGLGRASGPRLLVDAAADWEAMTDDEKRALISALVRITIKDSQGGRFFRPERVAIEEVAD